MQISTVDELIRAKLRPEYGLTVLKTDSKVRPHVDILDRFMELDIARDGEIARELCAKCHLEPSETSILTTLLSLDPLRNAVSHITPQALADLGHTPLVLKEFAVTSAAKLEAASKAGLAAVYTTKSAGIRLTNKAMFHLMLSSPVPLGRRVRVFAIQLEKVLWATIIFTTMLHREIGDVKAKEAREQVEYKIMRLRHATYQCGHALYWLHDALWPPMCRAIREKMEEDVAVVQEIKKSAERARSDIEVANQALATKLAHLDTSAKSAAEEYTTAADAYRAALMQQRCQIVPNRCKETKEVCAKAQSKRKQRLLERSTALSALNAGLKKQITALRQFIKRNTALVHRYDELTQTRAALLGKKRLLEFEFNRRQALLQEQQMYFKVATEAATIMSGRDVATYKTELYHNRLMQDTPEEAEKWAEAEAQRIVAQNTHKK